MRISKEGFIDYEVPIKGMRQQPQPDEGYYEQQPMFEGEDGRPQPYPQIGGAVYPGQEDSFLKWLFNFREEAIVPLRHVWRGEEYDFDNKVWTPGRSSLKVMNEDGITWGISLIESYTNPAFIVTDLDEKTYTFRMREISRVIWNSLSIRFKEFELKKSDIQRVAEEIESKVSAILRGALDNGYRDFFSTQNQNIETKNLTPMAPQQGPSIWSKAANFFRGNR